jgi:hypothetical protein
LLVFLRKNVYTRVEKNTLNALDFTKKKSTEISYKTNKIYSQNVLLDHVQAFFPRNYYTFFSESVHFPLFRLAKVEEKLFCIVFARVKKKVQDFNESVVVSFLQYKKSIKSVDGGGLKIYFSSAWNILLVFDFNSAINLIYSIKTR